MESNENNFRNVLNTSYEEKKQNKLKTNVVIPFLSGVIGCSVVIGTCFGVPSIKEKIIGNPATSHPITSITTSDKSAGTVDFVSLSKYSDTAVFASNKILPSIVGINVTYNITSSSMFGGIFGNREPSTSESSASGSGIVISEDGYILTNNHVVDSASQSTYYDISDATSVKVKLYNDETEYEAKIVGKDSQTDLAVLKIEKQGLTAAEFADSDKVKVGEFAMAVGNPLDLGTTITCGVVSAINREVSDSEDGSTFVCIQTDAAINSGNSGGALVNSEGKVIGVNTLKVSSTGVEGIGFAIPINSTVSITSDLINYSKVKRPFIGISGRDLDSETAKKYDLVEGVYVVTVEEFSAAEKAGLKPEDVIIAIDGKTIKTMDELNKIKNTHKIGDKVTLKIVRNGKEKELTLKLGEQK